MVYYQLQDCTGFLLATWTGSDLSVSGIILDSVFQAEENPGVCWQVVDVVDLNIAPTPIQAITPQGLNFVNCTECLDSIISGCMDPIACNYNPCATIEDGSCFYNNVTIRILCNDPITACGTNSNCE